MINKEKALKVGAKLAGLSDDKIILMTKFTPVPYAEKLMERYKFFYDGNKTFWRYDDKEHLWKMDASIFIKSKLRKDLFGHEQQKKSNADEVVDYIKGVCWDEGNIKSLPLNLIPFKNIMYDLETEEFRDYVPEYFVTNKIPIEIDSKYTDYDMIDYFFEELVGKNNKKILYELFAYCLYRSYPYQKLFILYGGGLNGKSAFLTLLSKFLGDENIASVKPQALTNDKFSGAELFNKLANISPDVPYTELQDTSMLRELTGDDLLTCQQKYKNPFKFKNYSKIIFSANELPRIRDRTFAFNRRIYIILFDKIIKKPIPNIVSNIATPSQLSGLGWKLIKILKELHNNNFTFTNDPSPSEMGILYDELSNSLSKFIKELIIIDTGSSIPKWEFKDRFLGWLSERGLRLWSIGELNHNMRDKFGEGRAKQDIFNKITGQFETKYVHSWEGLAWK